MTTLAAALLVDGPASLVDGPASVDGPPVNPDEKKGNGRVGCSNAGTCTAGAMWVAGPGVSCAAAETGSVKSCNSVIFCLSDCSCPEMEGVLSPNCSHDLDSWLLLLLLLLLRVFSSRFVSLPCFSWCGG